LKPSFLVRRNDKNNEVSENENQEDTNEMLQDNRDGQRRRSHSAMNELQLRRSSSSSSSSKQQQQ